MSKQNNKMGKPQAANRRQSGFTLIELLVVIAIIGTLAALLYPSLSHAKQRAQGTLCMNNGKQMMTSIVLYANENSDYFPPNPDDGNIVPGYNWCSGQAGIGGLQEFDSDVLRDPSRSLLITYLGGNINVFHCPADMRLGLYQGTNPSWISKIVPAARTFSMNQAVGTIDAGYDRNTITGGVYVHSGLPNISVNGPWLNNQGDHRRNSPWATYGKMLSIVAPDPSRLWVLVDENTSGLNDAAFAFGMEEPKWLDAPGSYHNGGCGFAFADGHSEIHTWLERPEPLFGANINDWQWMQQRTSAKVATAP